MKKLDSTQVSPISGGFSFQTIGNGMFYINNSTVDIMHQPTINERSMTGIDKETGNAKYEYRTVPNPQYRGNLVSTTQEICMVSASAAFIIAGTIYKVCH